jgi:phosphatidylinositol alpha-1,6-mannosyltransferase
MNVSLLTSTLDPSKGWGRYSAALAASLARSGLSVELHTPRGHAAGLEATPGLEIRRSLPAAFVTFGWRPWRLASLYAGSWSVRPRGRLVHSLVEVPYACLARWLGRRHRVPYLVTLHGSYAVKWANHPADRLLFGPALRDASALVAVSNRTAAVARLRLSRTPVEVIPNGVDVAAFAGAAGQCHSARAQLGLESGERLILSVGALKPRKGFDTLLDAFAIVRRSTPAAKLLIVGSGNAAPYRERARSLGIGQAVQFLQNVPEQQLRSYYHAADVFALLPREMPTGEMEGFGLVYLEAAACGKPCVGTRSGGVAEAVIDGQTGLLVAPDRPEEAARALLELLENGELARRLGLNGRRHAEEHSWENIAARYAALYEAVLRKSP